MIAMSEDFKKSVSETEREMKGYVEVSFVSSADKSTFTIDNEPEILSINGVYIPDTGLLDDDRKGKNYASLEQDYFLLDGTFVLPNNDATKNPGMGYVSKYTFGQQQEEISEVNPFHFTTNATGCSGITVYFQNNVPTDLEFRVSAGETTETFTDIDITDTGVASVTFSERDVTDLYIIVNDMLYTNRRLRIQEIDFGLSQIYEGEDLISFKTIEQCNRFADEMPINECEVVLGDYEGKFDVNNPDGITKYLGENVLIKPFVGVVTEDNGIEYCTLGTYWLDEWKNDKSSATLIGKDIFNKLKLLDYVKEFKYYIYYDDFMSYKSQQWGINIYNNVTNTSDYARTTNISGNKASIPTLIYKPVTQLESLQNYAVEFGNTFTSTREGNIKYINSKSKLVYDWKINKEVMNEYAEVKEKTKIKEINITEYLYSSKNYAPETTEQIIYNGTVVCNGETEFYVDFEQANSLFVKYSYSGGTAPQIITTNIHPDDIGTQETGHEGSYAYVYIKFNYVGNIDVSIKITPEFNYSLTEKVNSRTINAVGNNLEIKNKLDVTLNANDNNSVNSVKYNTDAIINYRISNLNNKELSCKFNGNPMIECGDCIEIENQYSTEENPKYDLVWVSKIEGEFKGSFNQTIEGDIIEN